MGPATYKTDDLLRMPTGCGEQNMINMAPNVFILKYLQAEGRGNGVDERIKAKAIDYLVKGYQRQLTFRREDGSYSAFGERDGTGNMW